MVLVRSLFVPGPTNVPDAVRKAIDVPMEDHRAPDLPNFILPLFEDLKKVFKTKTGQVFLFPASGTGGWEASMSNTLNPGDKVLAARFGQFSHLWINLCERLGLDVQVVECEWGTGVPSETFGEILAADKTHSIKAVLATQNETATGVKSDIANLRVAMDEAKKILKDLSSKTTVKKKNEHATIAAANGKVILLGEHAVVYGKPAVAVPIKDAVITEISDSDGRNELEVPAWDLDGRLKQSNNEWWKSLQDVFKTLGVYNKKFNLRVKPNIPAAVGLGGSAAIAVSIIRCVSKHFKLDLTDPEINDLAFVCETAAHGTASGIDNTIATFGEPLVYQREPSTKIETLKFEKPVSLVIGISNTPSLNTGGQGLIILLAGAKNSSVL